MAKCKDEEQNGSEIILNKSGFNSLWTPAKNLNHYQKYIVQLYKKQMVPLKYWVFNLDKSIENNQKGILYGESLNEKYRGPYLVPAYYEINPSEKSLEKFGIVEKRDLQIVFSVDNLLDVGVDPKSGDVLTVPAGTKINLKDNRLEVEEIEYVINETSDGDQFYGNYGFSVLKIGFAVRRQLSSVNDDRVDVSINVPTISDYANTKKREEQDIFYGDL